MVKRAYNSDVIQLNLGLVQIALGDEAFCIALFSTVVYVLEDGVPGSRFPNLINQLVGQGKLDGKLAPALLAEMEVVQKEMEKIDISKAITSLNSPNRMNIKPIVGRSAVLSEAFISPGDRDNPNPAGFYHVIYILKQLLSDSSFRKRTLSSTIDFEYQLKYGEAPEGEPYAEFNKKWPGNPMFKSS